MDHRREIYRQLYHVFNGVLAVALLYYGIINITFLGLLFVAGLLLSFISRFVKIPVIYWFLKTFDRKNTKLPGKGALTLLLGVTLTYYIFGIVLERKEIAFAAIMVLTLGDSVAPIAGRYIGKRPHPLNNVKLIEGTAAGIAAGFLGALIFLRPIDAILGSFFAMTLESVEFKIGEQIVDDNLSVPIVAGLVFYLTGLLF
jgi:dolichol kinase